MTSLAGQREAAAISPSSGTTSLSAAAGSRTIHHIELPLSGAHAVLTQRGVRQTLEILDAAGHLLGVVSDSLLDPGVLRGSWRGVRHGQPWALVVGRGVRGPVSVTFSSGRTINRRRIDVTPTTCGDFWLAEVAAPASRVSVKVAGAAAGVSSLQQVA